jgi:hypoxanthine phosphoribosyltransferase
MEKKGADMRAPTSKNIRVARRNASLTSLSPSSPHVPIVTLAELPGLARQLAQSVRAGGFDPQLIVYIESGARLLAWELCREFGIKAVPVTASRGGQRLKKWATPLLARLPRWLKNRLRRIEETSGLHRTTSRTVHFLPPGGAWMSQRVLLVDDAADTGRTLSAVSAVLLEAGLAPAQLRTAVLAATTPDGHRAAHFYVLDQNCCLPWSPDSDEIDLARRLHRERVPPPP